MAELSVLELRLTVVRGLQAIHDTLLAIWCSRRTRKPRPHVSRLALVEKLRCRGDILPSLAHRLRAATMACDRLLDGTRDDLGPTNLAELAALVVELRLVLQSFEEREPRRQDAGEEPPRSPPSGEDAPPPRGLARFVAGRASGTAGSPSRGLVVRRQDGGPHGH